MKKATALKTQMSWYNKGKKLAELEVKFEMSVTAQLIDDAREKPTDANIDDLLKGHHDCLDKMGRKASAQSVSQYKSCLLYVRHFPNKNYDGYNFQDIAALQAELNRKEAEKEGKKTRGRPTKSNKDKCHAALERLVKQYGKALVKSELSSL